ncbi:MAG: hypothetical protein GX811_00445 [Lentisphaerae bacterium]|nr:hypothetical protein [Lentisphaerota bacterium]
MMKDEAMGGAKKNCRLMILDFRLEQDPPAADWPMQKRSATGDEIYFAVLCSCQSMQIPASPCSSMLA